MARTETEGDPFFQGPSALVLQRDGISPPGSSLLHPAPEGQSQKLNTNNPKEKSSRNVFFIILKKAHFMQFSSFSHFYCSNKSDQTGKKTWNIREYFPKLKIPSNCWQTFYFGR